ncbi:MAG: YkgJ family cysteine cluster protein [Actinomycetota bacterium]|nr:YkgJ family cysteine cluster protein [Actinomycetota bacterium]
MKRKRRLSLADVYARIPEVHCKGLCEESCGPIAMSNDEDHRLQELGVTIPSMVDGVAAIERGEEYYCPALQDGRCRVYEDRPTICRLWGATTSMPCPHGCTPQDALSQPESFELLTLAGRAGGGMTSRFFNPLATDAADDHDGQVHPRSAEPDRRS